MKEGVFPPSLISEKGDRGMRFRAFHLTLNPSPLSEREIFYTVVITNKKRYLLRLAVSTLPLVGQFQELLIAVLADILRSLPVFSVFVAVLGIKSLN
jgi:hypothetical protein